MTMSAKRKDIIVSNLQVSLRKVLDCVPKQETWTAAQIISELTRKKQSIGTTSLVGSLNYLKNHKIVIEPKPGLFKQIECKPMAIKHKKEEIYTSDEDPLQGLRDAIVKISDVKADLELVLLEAEEYITGFDKKLEKLNQLKNLLKSIGN